MKKKIVSLMALLLCAVFVLGSCGSGVEPMAFSDVFATEGFEEDASFKTKAAITELDGATYKDAEGNLALFEIKGTDNVSTYKVYNVDTGAFVLTVTNSAAVTHSVKLISLWDEENAVISVTATETDAAGNMTTKLYDVSGAQVATAKGNEAVSDNADLVLFDDVYYRAKDGKLTKVAEVSPLSNALPTFTSWTDAYYYSENDTEVKIYDAATLKLVNVCYAASKCDSACSFVLQSGNVFFQEKTRLPDDASDYDLLEAEEKYALETYIFDVVDGEKSEIDFDYVVNYGIAVGAPYYEYAVAQGYVPAMKEVENIAWASPINDAYAEDSDYASKLLVVDNDGDVVGTLSDYLPLASGSVPTQIAKGRFVLTDVDGNVYLLDAAGNILGEANADNANSKYLVSGGRIFDLNLTELYDYEANDYELVSILTDTVLLSKDSKNAAGFTVTEYCIYGANGMITLLGADKDAEMLDTSSDCYLYFEYSEADKTMYAIYATDGTLILSSEYAINARAITDNAAVFATRLVDATGAVKTAYYRVTK